MVSRSVIDQAHNDLLQSIEELLREVKSRQEQQRIEEEKAERLRKIREEQVREESYVAWRGSVTGILVLEKMVLGRFFQWKYWSPGTIFLLKMVLLWKNWSAFIFSGTFFSSGSVGHFGSFFW